MKMLALVQLMIDLLMVWTAVLKKSARKMLRMRSETAPPETVLKSYCCLQRRNWVMENRSKNWNNLLRKGCTFMVVDLSDNNVCGWINDYILERCNDQFDFQQIVNTIREVNKWRADGISETIYNLADQYINMRSTYHLPSMKEDDDYQVQSILARRRYFRRKYYLIKWKGYTQAENTWEPIQHLDQVIQPVLAFDFLEMQSYKLKQKEQQVQNYRKQRQALQKKDSINNKALQKKDSINNKQSWSLQCEDKLIAVMDLQVGCLLELREMKQSTMKKIREYRTSALKNILAMKLDEVSKLIQQCSSLQLES